MKKFNLLILMVALLSFFISSTLFASIDGITGRTLKSGKGCSCHGSTPNSGVTVTIAGPDTVVFNQSTTFTLTISGGPASGSGCDIASKYGTLSAISSTLKLSGSELTNIDDIAMSSGTISYTFNYIYSGAQTIDTLYATGLSSNSNGSTSGDQWNWATSKRLVIVSPTGVDDFNSISDKFRLSQNYPNPFNPITSIDFQTKGYGFVSLNIYDVSGKEVASLVHENLPAGSYHYSWDANGFPSGIYLYRFESGGIILTKKLVLLK